MTSGDEMVGSQLWSSACIPFTEVLEIFPVHPRILYDMNYVFLNIFY